ncbi:TlpA disulfide reductase family protein [Nonomuraea sp. NPDC050310]|uniref:TlpA disulfide reductase family protein n=1 Tax=unclassified Nonomuraea TaxID=2593643 RepID=UPI0033F80466
MVYLTAAVVVLSLLTLLNLLLTVGVIRRLRAEAASRRDELGGVRVGAVVGEFATTDVDGRPISRGRLNERTLVGFFTPGCEPCAELLPRFVERAGQVPYDVIAVVSGPAEDYVRELAPVAAVVAEGSTGALQEAFRVMAFPSVYLIDGSGTVVAEGLDASLAEPVPA